MKAMLLLIVLIVLILLFVLFVPGRKVEQRESVEEQVQQGQTVQSEETSRTEASSTIREDLSDAADYGTGYMQLKAKQRTENKLDTLSEQHNKALSEELTQ